MDVLESRYGAGDSRVIPFYPAVTGRPPSVVVSRVGPAPVFDTVEFQHRLVSVENAGYPILSDAEFRERTAGQRLEELVGIAPL